MCEETTSTIAQLLFVKRPVLNFAHVVRDLDSALERCPARDRRLSWDCDDIAMFELDGARIVLGFADDLGGSHDACLTVSVGHGGVAGHVGPIARRRGALCRMITDRLSARYAVDEVLWHETSGIVTGDTVDMLLDSLPALAPAVATASATATPAPDAAPEPDAPRPEVDRLMARMDTELADRPRLPQRHVILTAPRLSPRRKTRPAPPHATTPPAAAAATPRRPVVKPVRNTSPNDLARQRAALYPDDSTAPAAETSLQMQIAVHLMNATLVVVALPVGAALVTHAVLRGQDFNLSARMMAITGTVMSLGPTKVASQLMAMI